MTYLKPVPDQAYNKVVTGTGKRAAAADSCRAGLYSAAWQVGDFIAQQNTQVSCGKRDSVPDLAAGASQYNALIGPLAAQHQAFNQAWTAAARNRVN